jgi:phospholipid transport system substrate-binding protein
MRRIVFVLGLAVLLAGAGHRVLAAGDAGAFINEAGNSVLKLLNDPKVSQAQFTQQLHKIADDDFDVPRIARFVTGRYWRDANDSERQQFVKAFSDYMVSVYAQRFGQYRGSAGFKVMSQRQEGESTMVSTEIQRSSGPPAKVVWQVAKSGDSYKIVDVSIEGVSQALTYRQEFDSVIAQRGGRLPGLTEELRQKTAQG